MPAQKCNTLVISSTLVTFMLTDQRPLPSIIKTQLKTVPSLSSSLYKPVKADFASVNRLIIERLSSDVELVENIGNYIVDSGGKRLRPLVVLLSALANGYAGQDHIKAAVIIEFIHTATLLHDDVVDVSVLRRGRQTANSHWGNAPSVLVGDFLYSRAFQMLVEIADISIMSIIADASNLISEGEVQQLANAGNPNISQETYTEVIFKKTAVLFEAAARTGGVLAGFGEKTMARYGRHLGMAFQISDDILDYKGSSRSTGKQIGADLAEGKMTLPLIFTRDQIDPCQAEVLRELVRGEKSQDFSEILDLVKRSGGLDYALDVAKNEVHQACEALGELPSNEFTRSLRGIAEFAVSRVI